MSNATAADASSRPARPPRRSATRRRSLNERKKARTGWLFVAPFAWSSSHS